MRPSRKAPRARLVAGVGEGTSFALDRLSWSEAAEVLALAGTVREAPSAGQTVWLVQLGGAAHEPADSGRAVVLDAATGRPYALVRLRAAAPGE